MSTETDKSKRTRREWTVNEYKSALKAYRELGTYVAVAERFGWTHGFARQFIQRAERKESRNWLSVLPDRISQHLFAMGLRTPEDVRRSVDSQTAFRLIRRDADKKILLDWLKMAEKPQKRPTMASDLIKSLQFAIDQNGGDLPVFIGDRAEISIAMSVDSHGRSFVGLL